MWKNSKMFNITLKYFIIFNNKPPASSVAHIARDFLTCYSCSYFSSMVAIKKRTIVHINDYYNLFWSNCSGFNEVFTGINKSFLYDWWLISISFSTFIILLDLNSYHDYQVYIIKPILLAKGDFLSQPGYCHAVFLIFFCYYHFS